MSWLASDERSNDLRGSPAGPGTHLATEYHSRPKEHQWLANRWIAGNPGDAGLLCKTQDNTRCGDHSDPANKPGIRSHGKGRCSVPICHCSGFFELANSCKKVAIWTTKRSFFSGTFSSGHLSSVLRLPFSILSRRMFFGTRGLRGRLTSLKQMRKNLEGWF